MKPHRVAFALSLLLAACAGGPAAAPAAAAPQPGACTVLGAMPPPALLAELRALQQGLPKAPLYAAAAGSGLADCSIEAPADGPARLTYRFRDGSLFWLQRDPRIELLEQHAEFAREPPADALRVLAAADKAAYGEQGCAIDWQAPETRTGAGGTDQIYRGQTCNCQARVRRNALGRITALALKSTC